MRENSQYLLFWVCVILLRMIISLITYLPANFMIFESKTTTYCVYVLHIHYPITL